MFGTGNSGFFGRVQLKQRRVEFTEFNDRTFSRAVLGEPLQKTGSPEQLLPIREAPFRPCRGHNETKQREITAQQQIESLQHFSSIA